TGFGVSTAGTRVDVFEHMTSVAASTTTTTATAPLGRDPAIRPPPAADYNPATDPRSPGLSKFVGGALKPPQTARAPKLGAVSVRRLSLVAERRGPDPDPRPDRRLW